MGLLQYREHGGRQEIYGARACTDCVCSIELQNIGGDADVIIACADGVGRGDGKDVAGCEHHCNAPWS